MKNGLWFSSVIGTSYEDTPLFAYSRTFPIGNRSPEFAP